jgi:hypothetical protein
MKMNQSFIANTSALPFASPVISDFLMIRLPCIAGVCGVASFNPSATFGRASDIFLTNPKRRADISFYTILKIVFSVAYHARIRAPLSNLVPFATPRVSVTLTINALPIRATALVFAYPPPIPTPFLQAQVDQYLSYLSSFQLS